MVVSKLDTNLYEVLFDGGELFYLEHDPYGYCWSAKDKNNKTIMVVRTKKEALARLKDMCGSK
jgi:hypothetical protein